MLEHLRDLMAHQSWADAIFFNCWGSSPEIVENENLRVRVLHIARVQENFRKLITEELVSRPPDEPVPCFADLKNRMRSAGGALRLLLQEMNEPRLKDPLKIPWFQESPCIVRVAEALVQVAMHTQHHRGQCMTVLKQLGGKPRNVDWIVWLWKGKPDGSWD